ncbi:MAG TPA: transcriptional repressor LexA [Thermoanaerobaculia bacterium]|nr:transcriptional repressor LexA [Thermoanaerobaculia bacterium]
MALTLTPRQKEIADFIRRYRSKHGVSPTQREICEEFGYSSFGTLQKHIRLLLEKGVLVRDWNKRRSLALAEEDRPVGAVEIPLAGRIAAGQPIEVEPQGESVSVPEALTRKGQNYVLRVSGHSMIDDGIHDGDFVVVNRREKAANGEMVAALVNGEATLKRFYNEGDGRVRLQPANDRMAPIYAPEGDVKVQGVVVGLMRKY